MVAGGASHEVLLGCSIQNHSDRLALTEVG